MSDQHTTPSKGAEAGYPAKDERATRELPVGNDTTVPSRRDEDNSSQAFGAVTQNDLDALVSAASTAPTSSVRDTPEQFVDAKSRKTDASKKGTAQTPYSVTQAASNSSAAAEGSSAPQASSSPPATSPPMTSGPALPDFTGPTASGTGLDPRRVSMLNDLNLNVKIELGRTRMLIEEVLKLGEGSVVELDKLAGDPVDVYANDRLIARGEVLVLNDNFCVRISEVVSRDPHRVMQ